MLKAKPVVENSLWILTKDNQKIGIIKSVYKNDEVILVTGKRRTTYPSFVTLKDKYNIIVDDYTKDTDGSEWEVCGFPTDSKPFNPVYDVHLKLPLYTKNEKSNSQFCAGHYLVQYRAAWVHEFCPKLLTLKRNKWRGPFMSVEEAKEAKKR